MGDIDNHIARHGKARCIILEASNLAGSIEHCEHEKAIGDLASAEKD